MSMDQHSHLGEEGEALPNGMAQSVSDYPINDLIDHAVEIFPSNVVQRRAFAWDGMAAEIVQATRHEKVEFRFRAPFHLLVAYEQGVRCDGETLVEGLPRSRLRDVKRKLTFVPAGHEYRDWQEARILSRAVYFYFDPAKMPVALRNAAENELVSLKPISNPISVTDDSGFANNILACSMRRLP